MSNAGGFKTLNRYPDMLAGNATFIDSSFDSIATTTVGAGGAATITFSSIPSTYQHLQIRILAKTGDGGAFGSISMTFNGNPGEFRHDLYGTGSSTGVSSINQSFYTYVGGIAQFGVSIIDILDYTNANKAKTSRSICGVDNNGSGLVAFTSGLETSTAAITSITLTSNSGNLAQYSSLALYGIKG
jgi:hypothetical protein